MPGITTSENTTSNGVGIAGQFLQRVGGVADQHGGVAEFGQRGGGEGPDLGIVLDHQHRHAWPSTAGASSAAGGCGGRRR